MVGRADGVGTFTVSGDASSSNGLDQYAGTVVTYNIAANGRGTAQAVGDQSPSIVYMISPTKMVVLMTDQDARVTIFQPEAR